MDWRAPCGHPGEAIIGTFVLCSLRCDQRCPLCQSKDIALLGAERLSPETKHCWRCGCVWGPGINVAV